MSPHENQAIEKLTEQVIGMRGDLRVLRTKLFGDDDTETDQGRIPRIEASLRAHGARLKKVEPIALVLRGLYAVLIAASGYLLHHFLPFKGR